MDQATPSNQPFKLSTQAYPSADDLYLQQFKPLLTPREFHEAMHGAIGLAKIYELLHAKRIKHTRLGRKILIPRQEVVDFPHREAYN